MDVISSVIEFFSNMPEFYRHVLLSASVALGVYLIIDLLGDIIFIQVIKWQVNLRSKTKPRTQKMQSVESFLYPPAIFAPTVKPEDIYGINILPWDTLFIVGGILGGVLGTFSGDSPLNTTINILIYAIAGFTIVFFAQWFFKYVRKIKTEKDAMDTMGLIQNELASQITLIGALNSIKNSYQSHVKVYGEKSWYYKNYVLARLVYLITTEPEFIAVNILKKLGEELGEVTVIKRIMQNSLIRIGQSGDAGTVLKEQIASYNEIYTSKMREEIPQFSDKLFFPIMMTHFVPFLIIIIWPIITVTNEMISGGVGTPTNPIFK